MSKSAAVTAGALLAVTALAGCSTPPAALGTRTAQVTINGQDTGQAHRIHCNQYGWNWEVETLEETPGFKAMFQTGDTLIPEAVILRGLNDFSGSYWRYTVGDAEARMTGNSFTMSGTARGWNFSQPDERTSATFELKMDC